MLHGSEQWPKSPHVVAVGRPQVLTALVPWILAEARIEALTVRRVSPPEVWVSHLLLRG